MLSRSVLLCSRRYVFHHCTWDTGECNEKLIQNQNHNCKLNLIYLENYIWICIHANDLGQHESWYEFGSTMIFTIKNTVRNWCDKFENTFLENIKASSISNFIVKAVPIDNSWGQKRIFQKVMFCFEKGTFSAFLVV